MGDQLGQDFLHDTAVHVGQTEIATGVAIRQLRMVEAEQMKHCGVQVVYVHTIFDRLKAEFIGRAVDMAPFYAAARQPYGEAVVVVVASVHLAGVVRAGQFDGRRPAELSAEHYQSLIEQAALFKIG